MVHVHVHVVTALLESFEVDGFIVEVHIGG